MKLAQLYAQIGSRFSIKNAINKLYFGRPFPRGCYKLLFLYESDNAIAFSQAFPFLFYAADIEERFGICVRTVARADFEKTYYKDYNDVDLVCFQSSFMLAPAELERFLAKVRHRSPDARLAYFDWFAPLDLRLASVLNEHIDCYVKKQVFRDLASYHKATHGDTNLTDYYGRAFNLEFPSRQFTVPESFFEKLVLGPGFFTADFMMAQFLGARPDFRAEQPIDLHARVGRKGSEWYTLMRQQAIDAVAKLRNVNAVTETGVNRRRYLAELADSKLCFSPFGYGEVCWRDYEAAMCGSLLIKPDMQHIRTDPDMFVDSQTYVATKWDFSDLGEKVYHYLENAYDRQRIKENAFSVVHNYLANKRFLDQMSPLFELAQSDNQSSRNKVA